MGKATIYIPDIGGFTSFVNDTEILHAKEITAGLLEEIIASTYLSFEISEIEGDAILFYKTGKAYSLSDIYKQTSRTVRDFENKKIIIDQQRSCSCGACSSIKNLTLKFILHFGELDEMKVGRFRNIFGKDVIIAHRLLKNNVPGKTYALLTEEYLNQFTDFESAFPEIQLYEYNQSIDDNRNIKCFYYLLSKAADDVKSDS
ncbi:MAG: hypothetical protein Kow0098_23790 [Ignavibacteriaceae bacterium]